MTSEELKAAIRAFIYDKDAYTSNGAANVVHAMDLLIDEIDGAGGSGGGATPGLDTVLAEAQVLTANRNITMDGHFISLNSVKALSIGVDGGGNYLNIGEAVGSGGTGIRIESTVSSKYADIDSPNGVVDIGDVSAIGNGVKLQISDGSNSILGTAVLTRFYTDGGPQIKIELGGSPELTLEGATVLLGNAFSLVTMAAATGKFSHSANTQELLSADASTGISQIRSFRNEDDGNETILKTTADDTRAEFRAIANFNDGVKEVNIIGLADAATSSLTYTADTHTFIGAVLLPTSDPGVAGALWNNAGTPAISAG